jgi:hypothetical protein
LNPGLAELCYIDTDSCVFSTTYEDLTDCLLLDKRDYFFNTQILADEQAQESCHGKMKLEGTFRAGRFKSLKIYRLFKDDHQASLDDFVEEEEERPTMAATKKLVPAYTRCKGVNRWLASKLPDSAFELFDLKKTVVHRTALRPVRTGEMVIAHEARGIAVPFNLKRWMTNDGYHSFPLSHISGNVVDVKEERGGEEEEEMVFPHFL